MSVTGLIVALGLLIDNAIVIVEEVRSRIMLGESPRQAIGASVRQLGMPLFGSTLTTTLAFLADCNFARACGRIRGHDCRQRHLGNLRLLPAVDDFDPGPDGVVEESIRPAWIVQLWIENSAARDQCTEASLRLIFRFPLIGVLLGLVLPALGFAVARNLPQQFFPPSDRHQIQIEVERPRGIPLLEPGRRSIRFERSSR